MYRLALYCKWIRKAAYIIFASLMVIFMKKEKFLYAQRCAARPDASLRQNLIDAGCSREWIDRFFAESDTPQQLQLLNRHRKQLLDNLHQKEKQIDCLDYLIYCLTHPTSEEKKGNL